MKQTKNHKLNLIEMSDTFSTDPLNENMETIDAALKAAGDATAAVSGRVGALEAKQIVIGTYSGASGSTGNAASITLGFKPRAVIIGGDVTLVVTNVLGDLNGNRVTLTDTGFRVTGTYASPSKTYSYIAFA